MVQIRQLWSLGLGLGCRVTFLELTSWVSGTNPSTLERIADLGEDEVGLEREEVLQQHLQSIMVQHVQPLSLALPPSLSLSFYLSLSLSVSLSISLFLSLSGILEHPLPGYEGRC